jgi:hypothetical protein
LKASHSKLREESLQYFRDKAVGQGAEIKQFESKIT